MGATLAKLEVTDYNLDTMQMNVANTTIDYAFQDPMVIAEKQFPIPDLLQTMSWIPQNLKVRMIHVPLVFDKPIVFAYYDSTGKAENISIDTCNINTLTNLKHHSVLQNPGHFLVSQPNKDPIIYHIRDFHLLTDQGYVNYGQAVDEAYKSQSSEE